MRTKQNKTEAQFAYRTLVKTSEAMKYRSSPYIPSNPLPTEVGRPCAAPFITCHFSQQLKVRKCTDNMQGAWKKAFQRGPQEVTAKREKDSYPSNFSRAAAIRFNQLRVYPSQQLQDSFHSSLLEFLPISHLGGNTGWCPKGEPGKSSLLICFQLQQEADWGTKHMHLFHRHTNITHTHIYTLITSSDNKNSSQGWSQTGFRCLIPNNSLFLK